ncbi:MAG: hypothetical protein R3F62_17970 [Planctomycetota bacterium]
MTVLPACCALALVAVVDRGGLAPLSSPLVPRTGWAGIAGTVWVLLAGVCFALRTRRTQNG